MARIRRRDLIKRGMHAAVALSVLPAISARARAEDACVDPASESFRKSMLYTDPSDKPEQACGSCGFFTPNEESGCGHCVIMSGPVSSTAWCESWSPKG